MCGWFFSFALDTGLSILYVFWSILVIGNIFRQLLIFQKRFVDSKKRFYTLSSEFIPTVVDILYDCRIIAI